MCVDTFIYIQTLYVWKMRGIIRYDTHNRRRATGAQTQIMRLRFVLDNLTFCFRFFFLRRTPRFVFTAQRRIVNRYLNVYYFSFETIT